MKNKISKGDNKLEIEKKKTKIGLRYTYERVYNNDVFDKSNTIV